MRDDKKPAPPEWVRDLEVAERLGVSRDTVWRWAKAEILPSPRRLGPRSTRWLWSEVEAHLAERTEAAGEPEHLRQGREVAA